MAPEDLLSVCCLVLPLVLSSVVLSPLVSSCLGFSALVSSCAVCWASPVPFLGLSRASLTHFGAPRQPLGHSGWLLGLPAPGLLPASLGPSWRLLGPPLRRLGRLLAAESECSRNLIKPLFLRVFCMVSGLLRASWRPLGPSWRLLGGSWAVLSGLGWLLGGSLAVLRGLGWLLAGPGLVPGWPRRRRNHEGSENPYLFIV